VNKTEHITLYTKYIYDIYLSLKKAKKTELTNMDLSKIFEYYSSIKLESQNKKQYYLYEDIDPNFKELNKMSQSDTGIDLCDLVDTIVQCKLRSNYLGWQDCATFFGSNIFKNNNELQIKWRNMIITRNACSKLSKNLIDKSDLFLDVTYDKKEMITYCENLLLNPIVINDETEKFVLRDYQKEAINLIKNNSNCVINLPTGTGKNIVIINSLLKDKAYLMLVPRIALMDQLYEEILKHKPSFKNNIQLIGNGKSTFNTEKLITVCVYNSINLITDFDIFTKIFIDEAHHIAIPELYSNEIENNSKTKKETYLETISNLKKFNNNVYLSATIDKIEEFAHYYKDIRDMIKLGYLCDYTLNVPIFNNDPTDHNICEYLIQKYMNVIIYCDTQEVGNKINNLMNELLCGCSEYIDCKTPKSKIILAINKYKSGEILFLVNVRVLTEGFDAPITKGVCFMHLPKSGTTIIQIIGRALRLHKEKSIANVILPYSCDEDSYAIKSFLKIVAKNDSRIKQSYESKTLGGYINVNIVDKNKSDENNVESDIEFRYEMIHNSLGELENGVEIWLAKLKMVIDYIEKYGKFPPSTSKNYQEKHIGKWILTQKINYTKIQHIMKNKTIYDKWTEFTTSGQNLQIHTQHIFCHTKINGY